MKAAHVLIIVLALLPLKAAARNETAFVLDGITYIPVPYCELMGHPMEYDGKRIAVRASYMLGFENQVMFSMKCSELTSLAFMPETLKAERVFYKARHQGTYNATFYGMFHKENSIKVTGIQGPHQFDVCYMDNIEVISKSDGDPHLLSEKAQQKLCQGTETPKKP